MAMLGRYRRRIAVSALYSLMSATVFPRAILASPVHITRVSALAVRVSWHSLYRAAHTQRHAQDTHRPADAQRPTLLGLRAGVVFCIAICSIRNDLVFVDRLLRVTGSVG